MFIALGLSGVIPCVHYLITDGFWSAVYEASLVWLLLMAFMYIAGALLYAARIPERFFPGRCDIWFHSHQWFHLFVVVATWLNWRGLLRFYQFRTSSGCNDNAAAFSLWNTAPRGQFCSAQFGDAPRTAPADIVPVVDVQFLCETVEEFIKGVLNYVAGDTQ